MARPPSELAAVAREVAAALEAGAAAVRGRARVATRGRRPIEGARRFFRRRVAEVGLAVGFARLVERRAAEGVSFENAEAAQAARGDEAERLRAAHAALVGGSPAEDERAALDAIEAGDPRRIFPSCLSLAPGSAVLRFYALHVDPDRSLDQTEWRRLATEVRDAETAGWALFHAAIAQERSDPGAAPDLFDEAARLLPPSLVAHARRAPSDGGPAPFPT